jgi:16S rRNA processing protein RimM
VSQPFVPIGRLIRVRGNRGELVGELDNPDPERAERLKEIRLELGERSRAVRIEQVWSNPSIYEGRPVFKFEGIDSISDAEPWSGAQILVPPSEVAEPEEGAYTFAELVGCKVVKLDAPTDSNHDLIGTVEAVEEFGGPPVLRVRSTDGREFMIPFAKSICKQIDPAAKLIGVDLPEGLLDL